MQNAIQKFRQSSIVFEKPGILSENLKTLTSFNYPTVQYFLLKLRTRLLLTNVCKRVCGSFFILFTSDKKPDFSEIIEINLNLGIGFCINWLVMQNYKKISP